MEDINEPDFLCQISACFLGLLWQALALGKVWGFQYFNLYTVSLVAYCKSKNIMYAM